MITQTRKAQTGKSWAQSRADERLDGELEDTFPASDPPSLTEPHTGLGGPDRAGREKHLQSQSSDKHRSSP